MLQGFDADFQPLNMYLPFHIIHWASEKSIGGVFQAKTTCVSQVKPYVLQPATFSDPLVTFKPNFPFNAPLSACTHTPVVSPGFFSPPRLLGRPLKAHLCSFYF